MSETTYTVRGWNNSTDFDNAAVKRNQNWDDAQIWLRRWNRQGLGIVTVSRDSLNRVIEDH